MLHRIARAWAKDDRWFTVLLWIAVPIVAAFMALGIALVLYWLKNGW